MHWCAVVRSTTTCSSLDQVLLKIALTRNQDNFVLSQGMSRFVSQVRYAFDFGSLLAAVIITVLPVLVMYGLFQRQLHESVGQA